jgi:predicted DNA-binding transcriptional regulator YafY
VLRYRLSRIVPGTVQVLPDKIPPGRRPVRTYTIRYRLEPAIARGGVTPRFPETTVHLLDDGSAEVEAEAANLWHVRQVLLRYGEHCQALAPEELVRMMRETVLKMAVSYGPTTGSDRPG